MTPLLLANSPSILTNTNTINNVANPVLTPLKSTLFKGRLLGGELLANKF